MVSGRHMIYLAVGIKGSKYFRLCFGKRYFQGSLTCQSYVLSVIFPELYRNQIIESAEISFPRIEKAECSAVMGFCSRYDRCSQTVDDIKASAVC